MMSDGSAPEEITLTDRGREFLETMTRLQNNQNTPGTKSEEIWCEEGCRRVRFTLFEDSSMKIETIDTTNGWPGNIIDTVTLANFRVQYVKALLIGAV